MKFDYLKKKLIKIGIICLVIVLVVGGITFFIMNYNDKLAADITKIKADTAQHDSEYVQTEKSVKDSKDALEFYSDYSGSDSANPDNFRREYAKTLLGKIKDQIGLVDLKFSMDQFKEKSKETTKNKVALFTSKVTVELAANSDVDIYQFIKILCQNFPGNVQVTSYEISRKVELSDDKNKLTEDMLSKGLVSGKVEFQWGTILDNVDPKKNDAAKPNQAAKAAPAEGAAQ